MGAMVLRIDPDLPLVWRTPHSLQLGVDRPAVVLTDLTGPEERMLAALVSGISRTGLTMIGASAGVGRDAVAAFLERLAPALRPPLATPRWPVVSVVGAGPTAAALVDGLIASRVAVRVVADGTAVVEDTDELAVVVAHFVVEPEHHGLWLRRDIPHLPIVFGDTGTMVGPLVEPGTGPCLYCLERARTDEDAAWPAMATQLWGRRSAVDGGLAAVEVAALAARTVLHRLREGPSDTARAVHLDAATGVRRSTVSTRHPECGCGALPGNATVDGSPSAAEPPPPRRAAVASGRG
jgi:bacteriocin biosynthesis cyclodehydratase domain-containing protein